MDSTEGPQDTHTACHIWLPQKYKMCPNCRGSLSYIGTSNVTQLSSILLYQFLTRIEALRCEMQSA